MSGYAGEFDALASAFNAAWAGRLQVEWPNVAFNTPSSVPWCRFTILNAESARMTIGAPGSNRSVWPGRVVLQVFYPRGGSEPMKGLQYADEAAEIFMKMRLDGFRFFLPSVQVVNNSLDVNWFQYNVTMPFQRNEYNG